MNKTSYFFLINILILLVILFSIYIVSFPNNKEQFTPKINAFYRPYVRHVRNNYDYFMNQVTTERIINKLRKWNIY
jgi:predicted RND superfamily exporter protein